MIFTIFTFGLQTTGGTDSTMGHPAYPNRRTHWWDVSFVYGSDKDTVSRTRTFEGGRIHAGKDGVMGHTDAGIISTGDNKNSWIGVSLLQACVYVVYTQEPQTCSWSEKIWKALAGRDKYSLAIHFAQRVRLTVVSSTEDVDVCLVR